MKCFNLRKGLKLKTLLILVVFIASTTSIISQTYKISTENDFLEDSTKQNIKSNEENDGFRFKLNSNIFSGITASQLLTEDSLNEGITLVSILLITNLTVVIKKYKKLSKSETKIKTNNHQTNSKISTQESLVLNLVHDYLSKNRYLEVNKIVPYLNAILSKSEPFLNKNGIKVVVSNLIKKNLLVDGSKLTRDDVLKNTNRLKIYNIIVNNPGIHLMNIINLLGMSIFLVKWHLNMLLKFNFVKRTNVENREIYYDLNLSEKKAKFLHFMGRERTIKIIKYLKKNPNGLSKYRISKELRMHPNTISKYIHKLEELDILSRKDFSNKTLYMLKNTSFL